MTQQRRVRILNAEVARKIAAGEVIDKPCAIVREFMDNAVDSGANRIRVEISGGGIEKIRVIDNGCGMTKEDLSQCAHPHATSKISAETDLLTLTTLGFRGEALSSIAAVSRLEIKSGGWKMSAAAAEERVIEPCAATDGTIAQSSGLFENFPARRQFLKRPASEGMQCKLIFEEKILPRPDISFSFSSDGEEKLSVPAGQSLKERFVQTSGMFESSDLFYELNHEDRENLFSFTLIIGEPSVARNSRKDISIYVNKRKIQEYSLVQAIVYGTQGYFPNGTFPVACLFVDIDPSLVDFNIHPAKREARFKDINALHHAVSSATRNFFKQYTVKSMLSQNSADEGENIHSAELSFAEEAKNNFCIEEPNAKPHFPEGLAYPDIRRPAARSSFSAGDTRSSFFRPKPAGDFFRPMKPNYITEPKAADSSTEENFHYTGCALGTFIIAEKDETLYIIDQHAAHERMIYNQIMAESGQRQALLVPYTVQTDSAADDNFIRAIQEKLEEAGFSCRDCGSGKWEFSTVPVRWKGTEEDLKKDVLDRRINPSDMINAAAASAACRSAVMDGTVLDDETARKIAKGALELPDPHCPHGRPVYTTITRQQLFSLVKRT
ncbi:DNA mismatch repair endonuclease MutL [Treponema sp.]|uniref:DNA mismatch repair endonuclease MutL n=1 Tax=Treponema sp. TaxID=166 RepID=UPI003EFE94DC